MNGWRLGVAFAIGIAAGVLICSLAMEHPEPAPTFLEE